MSVYKGDWRMQVEEIVRRFVEVKLTFADGTVKARGWTYPDMPVRDILNAGPDSGFLREASKIWDHPQDPILFTAFVKEGYEKEAIEWLESL